MSKKRDEEAEAPSLQDTAERDALPVPLPTDAADEGAPAPEAVDEPAPVEPAAESPGPVPEPDPAPIPDPDPIREPDPDPAPAPPDPAAAEGNGTSGHDAGLPPFEPSPSVAGLAGAEEGPPLEVLVGAAFLGGLALAFLIKRLGN